MPVSIFFKGIIMGILIALPTGPVGFLTIRRTYIFGLRSGLYSALGAIMSDAFYAVVVGFGLRKISDFLISIATITEVIAGGALIWVAFQSLTKTLNLNHIQSENHPFQDISSIAVLNLLNPTLIFSFTTLFLVMGMQHHVGNPHNIITFIIGIATGTLGFWLLVGKGIVLLRRHNKDHLVQKINRIIGIILGIAGVVLLSIAARQFLE